MLFSSRSSVDRVHGVVRVFRACRKIRVGFARAIDGVGCLNNCVYFCAGLYLKRHRSCDFPDAACTQDYRASTQPKGSSSRVMYRNRELCLPRTYETSTVQTQSSRVHNFESPLMRLARSVLHAENYTEKLPEHDARGGCIYKVLFGSHVKNACREDDNILTDHTTP